MAFIRVERKELGRLRFGRLQETMGWGRAQTLGCLALFWSDTRAESIEEAHPDDLAKYVCAPLNETAAFITALKLAGYLQGGDGFDDLVRIVDNADVAAQKARLRARAVKGGKASVAARAPAKPPAKPRAKAVAKTTTPVLTMPIADTTSTPFQAACRATWEAYSQAYARVTGQPPVRNAKSSALIVQFVKRIGYEESPDVLAFYVTHPNPWYAERCYPLELAVKECEGLRTQWAMGRPITRQQARAHGEQSEIDRRRDAIKARIAQAARNAPQ